MPHSSAEPRASSAVSSCLARRVRNECDLRRGVTCAHSAGRRPVDAAKVIAATPRFDSFVSSQLSACRRERCGMDSRRALPDSRHVAVADACLTRLAKRRHDRVAEPLGQLRSEPGEIVCHVLEVGERRRAVVVQRAPETPPERFDGGRFATLPWRPRNTSTSSERVRSRLQPISREAPARRRRGSAPHMIATPYRGGNDGSCVRPGVRDRQPIDGEL